MQEQSAESTSPQFPTRFWCFVAVVLPCMGFMAELGARTFQLNFFDPFPTPAYVALAAIGNVAALVGGLLAGGTTRLQLRGGVVASSFAITASAFWAFAFLPALPMIFFAVFLFGLGILAAAPYWGVIGNSVILAHTARRLRAQGGGGFTTSLAAGVLLFAIPAAIVVWQRASLTDRFEQLLATAAHRDQAPEGLEPAGQAIAALRAAEFREPLLRRGWGFDFTDPGRVAVAWPERILARATDRHPVDPFTARWVWYRVTGQSFRDAPRPDDLPSFRFTRFTSPPRPSTAMAIRHSEVEANVEHAAGLAYVQWTMRIHNNSQWNREALLDLSVPKGSVPSRLSLWIDGEERRAAFAPREQATNAYTTVVDKRRDPALLVDMGAGRLRLGVFPVPPTKERTVRVGLTVPLTFDAQQARIPLPALASANFVIEGVKHQVRIRSDAPMHSTLESLQPDDEPESDGQGVGLRGAVANSTWLRHSFAIAETSLPGDGAVYGSDRRGTCRQSVRRLTREAQLGPLVLLVEGSQSMRGAVDWKAFFEELPADLPCHVLVAGDVNRERTGSHAELAQWLTDLSFVGGTDPGPLLARASRLVAEFGKERTTVLWIHGDQPEVPRAPPKTRRRSRWDNDGRSDWGWTWRDWDQRFGRGRFDATVSAGSSLPVDGKWFAYQAAGTKRRIADAIGSRQLLDRIPHHPAALPEFARRFGPAGPRWQRVLERLPADTEAPPDATRVSDHLCRLWAAQESRTLAVADRSAATELALDYRLVTPLTAAVVLETKEQYERFGLDPHAAADVDPPLLGQPVPEWDTVWLVLLGGIALLLGRRRFT